ncbi:hypothetical protein BH10PSE12_BH10PSE12_02730 [soil metagenome]
MKLVVRTVATPRVAGGRVLVLCDEHGAMLPGQSAVEIAQEDEGGSVITVSFEIDGRDVILDGSPIDGAA